MRKNIDDILDFLALPLKMKTEDKVLSNYSKINLGGGPENYRSDVRVWKIGRAMNFLAPPRMRRDQ